MVTRPRVAVPYVLVAFATGCGSAPDDARPDPAADAAAAVPASAFEAEILTPANGAFQ